MIPCRTPAIATLASGRQVVAFERVWTADIDHDVFLNVVNAAGTATQFSIANPLDVQANASWQANPAVAAIGNVALVVFEDGTGTTTSSANIRGRFFDGTSNTLGAAFTIADHTGAAAHRRCGGDRPLSLCDHLWRSERRLGQGPRTRRREFFRPGSSST